MTMRTTSKTVIFQRPFVLGGFDEELPEGAYRVETDEELLEGISFQAYRRTLAWIHLPAKAGHPGRTRTLTIDPNELDAAIERDRAPDRGPGLPGLTVEKTAPSTSPRPERGDPSGGGKMIVRQGQPAAARHEQATAARAPG